MGKKFDQLSQQYENFSNNLHPLSLSFSSNAQDELDDIRLGLVDVDKNEAFDLQEVYSSEEEPEKVKSYPKKFPARQNTKFMQKTTTANVMTVTQRYISSDYLNQIRKKTQVKNVVQNEQNHYFKMNKIEITKQKSEIHHLKQTQKNGKTVNFRKFILNKTTRHIQLLYTAKIITQQQKDQLQEAAKTSTHQISSQLPLNVKKHIKQYQRSSQMMKQILKSECDFKRKIYLLKNCLKLNKKQNKEKKAVNGSKMEVIEEINSEQFSSN